VPRRLATSTSARNAAKYFHSLRDGDVPLLLLFSGTVFTKGPTGFSVEPIAWHEEAPFRLPVQCWRDAMELHFPNSGWIRLPVTTLDRLQQFKAQWALPSWESTIEQLLEEAGGEGR
jgi:hypothetical protein